MCGFDSADKLVMTLLVKNEEDIVIDNILYHYAHGVDHILVTDNGSHDGTRARLRWLEAHGLITCFQAKGFDQAGIVNRMGEYAHERLGATVLFHCDADEFWTPAAGSDLKEAFRSVGRNAALVRSKVVVPSRQ